MSSPDPDDHEDDDGEDVNNFLAAIGQDDSPSKRSKSIRISSSNLNGDEPLVPIELQPTLVKGKSGATGAPL